jgi:hypothetical protein
MSEKRPEIARWTDHAYMVVKQGEGLLSAIQSVKKQFDLESKQQIDTMYKGGPSDVKYEFRGVQLPIESPNRPALPRISIFQHPDFNAKQIIKKFPDQVPLGKVMVTQISTSKSHQIAMMLV